MPTEDELVICSRDPSDPEGGDSEDDKGAISTAMETIIDIDQNSYAGFVDGEHWATLISCFEWAEERHYQPHAVVTARRMAETANDVPNDLVMAMFEIVKAEYDEAFDRNGIILPEITYVWRTFDAMCEEFASGYRPKNATEFVRDLFARLTGNRA